MTSLAQATVDISTSGNLSAIHNAFSKSLMNACYKFANNDDWVEGMTAAAIHASSLASEVTATFDSPWTITEHTLNLLRALLGSDREQKGIKAAPKRPVTGKQIKASVSATTSRTRAVASQKTIKASKPPGFVNNDQNVDPLHDVAGRRLATHAFNAAMKCLTDCAKAKLKDGGTLGAHTTSNTTQDHRGDGVPLSQRSPNRQSMKPLAKASPQQRDVEIEIVADCAITSLQYLQKTEPTTKLASKAIASQHEQGGLMLLDRFITLSLVAKAKAQAALLYICYQDKSNQTSRPVYQKTNNKVFTNLCLPVISTDGASNTEFTFVTSLQSQLLRLFILTSGDVEICSFQDQIKLDKLGSPARNIITGHEHGYIEKERAGIQLRTISQALLRMYSVVSGAELLQDTQVKSRFSIFVEALKIKCYSWKLLKHQPQLEEEFWTPLTRAAKKLMSAMHGTKFDLYQHLIENLDCLLSIHAITGFGAQIPKLHLSYFAGLADKFGDNKRALRWLEQPSENLQGDLSQEAILAWQKASLCYKTEPTKIKTLRVCFDLAVETTRKLVASDSFADDSLLVHVARFRKVCLNIILDSQDFSESSLASPRAPLETCCIRILSSLLDVSCKSLPNKASSETKAKAQKSNIASALTSVTKSVEAILHGLKCRRIQLLLPSTELHELLQDCQSCLNDLRPRVLLQADGVLSGFFESLHVQISNILWQEWIRSNAGNEAVFTNIEILDQSIAAVSSSSSQAQKAASLGMKWEKRATTALQMQDLSLANKSFEHAISYHISIGALAEAVESALSSPYNTVWLIPKTARYMLGRSLKSLISINLTHDIRGPSSQGWFYDDPELLPIQRAVLFEAQVSFAADHAFSEEQGKALVEHIQNAVRLCSGHEYHVYRQRFVLHLLQLRSKFFSFPIDTALDAIQLDQLCTPAINASENIHLASYGDWLAGSLQIQWAIHCNTLTTAPIWTCANSLCLNILQIPDSATLQSSIDDVNFCIKQLEFLLARARMIDSIEDILQCLLTLVHVYSITSQTPHSQHIVYICQLGRLYSRLDRMSESSRAFLAAKDLLLNIKDPTSARTYWALTYADYFVELQDDSGAKMLLDQAYDNFSILYPDHASVCGRQRLDRDENLVLAAMIASRLSFQGANITQACRYLRQAVKISAGIWQAIEQSQIGMEESTLSGNREVSTHKGSLDLSSTISSQDTTPAKLALAAGGVAFLRYFELHCVSLWHTAQLSMHCSLYQDALYYGEQLQKIATTTQSMPWLSRANSFLAALFAKTGNTTKAMEIASRLLPQDFAVDVFENCEAKLYLVEAMVETGQTDGAQRYIKNLIQDEAKKLNQPTQVRSQTTISSMESKSKKSTKQGSRRPPDQQTLPKSCEHDNDNRNMQTLSQQLIQGKTLSLQLMLQHNEINGSDGRTILPTASKHLDDIHNPLWRPIAAQKLLEQGLIKLSSDAVKCVLGESALALPVQSFIPRRKGRVSFIQADASPIKSRARKPARQGSKAEHKPVSQPLQTGEQLLLEARQTLSAMDTSDLGRLPCDSLHLMGRLRSKLSLLSSATETPFEITSLQVVLQELQTKDLVRQRELATAEAELSTKDKSHILTWPEVADDTNTNGLCSAPVLLTEADLADLPPSWSLISLSLAQDQKELFISKVMAGKAPFFLRIPLSRSDLDVQDQCDFTFQEARSELHLIVDQANKSCHDKRGQGDKQARHAWFQQRQSLDDQLSTWLANIESIWFGGFRGLMTPVRFTEEILSAFEAGFLKALRNHLPSRQKSFGQSSAKVKLHAHVLELFLGLGSPDQQGVEDAVADLLYFVVDILQFNGERNAYDEIDFDALTVEVLDVLGMCYETLADPKLDVTSHTVLIIDKDLEPFPWESLSCLRDQSVTRMPSFGAVLERIKRIREQNKAQNGYTLPTSRGGAYVLNPSSDLVSTESTFKPILETHLPDFQSLIRTIPTEAEFESMLRDNELVLYFGHGSGAQYIRGRSIRAMKSCAVTLLMGCSSAKMTQCGKLESYGMPGYYVGGMSGCMAMVGTLWDVTDRDIDRFALKLMVEWGLIDEDENVVKALERGSKKAGKTAKSRAKGLSKAKDAGATLAEKRGKISLSEAVSKGRDACVLRYLNGAAPVIYGIPVFLE